jgi:hypothetical protein
MGAGIDHRAGKLLVTQKSLDGSNPAACIEQLRRAGVPEAIRKDLHAHLIANGNMISRTINGQTFNFGYDAENRLVSVSGAATASFVYDGDGSRVQSTINGTSTTFIGNYYSVTDSSVTKNYGVYPEQRRRAGTQLIAVRKDGALSYLLSDHLGSISLTVDSSRTVTVVETFGQDVARVRRPCASRDGFRSVITEVLSQTLKSALLKVYWFLTSAS